MLCPAVRVRPHPLSEAAPVADFETHSRLGFRELGHLAGSRTIDNHDFVKLDRARAPRNDRRRKNRHLVCDVFASVVRDAVGC